MSVSNIETFTATTGWSTDGTIHAEFLNANPYYIANDLLSSLVIHIPAGSRGKYIEKTVAFDVSAYEEVVVYAWSRNKGVNGISNPADYNYRIIFNASDDFYFPIGKQFQAVEFGASGMSAITKIRIVPLHNDEDFILLSSMVASKDQIPLDIFKGIKRGLEAEILSRIGYGIDIGTISAATGDTSVTFTTAYDYIQHHMVVLIKDDANSEVHHIDKFIDGKMSFSKLYDGEALLHTYSGAKLYVKIPVEYGRNQMPAIFPSMVLWGMTPEHILRNSKIETIRDSHRANGSIMERLDGGVFKYNIMLDLTSTSEEIIALMSEVARKWIAKEVVWINGRDFRVVYETVPTEIEPTQAYEIIPKIQYILSLEYIEELWQRATKPKIAETTLTATLV